ncbi:MAG: ribonuclease [Clostridia bacterium]|nr:ribonuclease [Clostridia bacterium]
MKQPLYRVVSLLVILTLLLSLLCPALAEPLLSKSKKKKKTTTPTQTPAIVESTPVPTGTPEPEEDEGPIIEPQKIADYLFVYGHLPDNFLTKKEAQALGWDSRVNYVSDVAPGMSIGGDYFGNYEGLLPKAKGRSYYECDCYYEGGKRSAYRIIFSNDGLVFYTEDHYQTFEEMHPSVPGTTRAP